MPSREDDDFILNRIERLKEFTISQGYVPDVIKLGWKEYGEMYRYFRPILQPPPMYPDEPGKCVHYTDIPVEMVGVESYCLVIGKERAP